MVNRIGDKTNLKRSSQAQGGCELEQHRGRVCVASAGEEAECQAQQAKEKQRGQVRYRIIFCMEHFQHSIDWPMNYHLK